MKHKLFRGYFITGLLVWLPIWLTLVVISFIVNLLDGVTALLPDSYQPVHWLGFNVPGFGFVISIVVVFITGILVTNIVGRKLVQLGEAILARIPLVSTLYQAIKQVSESLFKPGERSFRHVLLVEYPRQGIWSLAFQTGSGVTEVSQHIGEEMVTLFIPTTPNPTSGFLMMVPRNKVVKLDMSIDEAFKYVMSLGVVQPINVTSSTGG